MLYTFKLVILLASCGGWFLLYTLYLKKNIVFFPITMVSLASLSVYLFGIIDILDIGVYAFTGAGLVFLLIGIILLLYKHPPIKCAKSQIFNIALLFVFICTFWLWIITRNSNLSFYDDYTHWYRICKVMNSEHRFPVTPDINYKSYVPGAAVWIYFVTRFTGFTVSNCFFAQAFIAIASVALFLAAIPNKALMKHKLLSLLYIGVVLVLLGAVDVTVYSLMVDSIVALVPLAGIILILSDEKKDSEAYIIIVIIACFTSLIKTSGLVFVIFMAIIWFITQKDIAIDKIQYYKNCIKTILLVLIPALITYLYSKRANTVFGDITYAPHNVSLRRWRTVLRNRSLEKMVEIIRKFFSMIFMINGSIAQVSLIWLSLFGLVILIFVYRYKNKKTCHIQTILLFSTICLVLYCLGLLGTYMFSMSDIEANTNTLASWYRYTGTIAIFLFGLFCYFLLGEIYSHSDKMISSSIATITCLLLFIGSHYFDIGYIWGYDFYKPQEEMTTKAWELCNEYVEENLYYTDESYLVLWDSNILNSPQDSDGRLTNMMQTYLRSLNVKTLDINLLLENEVTTDELNKLQDYDYLITLGDFTEYRDSLQKYFLLNSYQPGINHLNS